MNTQHTRETISDRVSHRRGFALIITLSALSVIIALTTVLVTYIDEARKDASITKAMIQGNLYYADLKKTFNSFKKRETLYSVLYLSPIPLSSEDGRFSISVFCKPLSNGVNINWLSLANNLKMQQQYEAAQKVFEYIVESYNIEEPTKLYNMLLDEMGNGKEYVQRKQSRLRQKNGIISTKQFISILERYQIESDDSKIGLIPWEEFFVFNKVYKDPKENVIDGNYISAELISALFAIDKASVEEEWIDGSDLKELVTSMGETFNDKLFSKKFLNRTKCDAMYDFEGKRFGFSFRDIEGEVKDFEFFGKE